MGTGIGKLTHRPVKAGGKSQRALLREAAKKARAKEKGQKGK